MHVIPALWKIGWLPVQKHFKYTEALITYKCMNGLTPRFLSKLFAKSNEINEINIQCERVYP